MVEKYSTILRIIAKVAIKCEKIVPYDRIFYVMNEFKQGWTDW